MRQGKAHVEGAVPTTHRLSVVIAAQLADLLVSFQGMAAPKGSQ